MAPPSKLSNGSTARRKSTKTDEKQSKLITLKLSPDNLRKFGPVTVKVESPSKESSSTSSTALPVAATPRSDNPSESASNTPAANGTPVPSSMPPPTEIIKKRGVKRSSAVALGPDGLPIPKVRGKPGPKKRPRLEDGSIDHSNTTPRAAAGTAAHKLGPKANQGAINAGLRALDRTGKPCRKWARGGFKLKSFTGVIWELPRWTAPPKITIEPNSEDSVSGGSSKENKENSQMASEKSNGAAEVDVNNSDGAKSQAIKVEGAKASIQQPAAHSPATSAQPVTSASMSEAVAILPVTASVDPVDQDQIMTEVKHESSQDPVITAS